MYFVLDFLLHLHIFLRNASNTHFNTHFSTHSLWLIKIHMGPTKFIWDPHDLVGPMWILTNQRECVEKCVLECVLLAFLYILLYHLLLFYITQYIWEPLSLFCTWLSSTAANTICLYFALFYYTLYMTRAAARVGDLVLYNKNKAVMNKRNLP